MRDLTGQVRAWRGTVVGREWFLPVAWGSGNEQHQTMIFAIHLDTGDRRHVSGTFPDPRLGTTEVGSGDPFVQVMDLALHSDGMLYGVGATSDIADPKLWRIDPTTVIASCSSTPPPPPRASCARTSAPCPAAAPCR